MNARRREVKVLIQCAPTLEAADKVIRQYYGFESVEEKIAFLKGMFDIEIIDHDTPDNMTYFALLETARKTY